MPRLVSDPLVSPASVCKFLGTLVGMPFSSLYFFIYLGPSKKAGAAGRASAAGTTAAGSIGGCSQSLAPGVMVGFLGTKSVKNNKEKEDVN